MPDRRVLVTEATVSRLQGVAKVAVTGALHDRLRAGELDASAETPGHGKVGTAYQQKPQLRLTQRLVKLGIATLANVQVEPVGSLPNHFVFEGVSSCELVESRGHPLSQTRSCLFARDTGPRAPCGRSGLPPPTPFEGL